MLASRAFGRRLCRTLGIMSTALPVPHRASKPQALSAAFVGALHLKLALSHNLAAELGSEQIASAYQSGAWPPPSWARDAEDRARADFSSLRRSIARSATVAGALAVTAVGVAAALGKVHPGLPPDFGKVAAVVGATVITWGAALQLYPARATWRGTFLHEVAHATLVRALLILGSALAGLGALWWQ